MKKPLMSNPPIPPLEKGGEGEIEREITLTDEKIDEIVYGLYGITEEEIKIIEESSK